MHVRIFINPSRCQPGLDTDYSRSLLTRIVTRPGTIPCGTCHDCKVKNGPKLDSLQPPEQITVFEAADVAPRVMIEATLGQSRSSINPPETTSVPSRSDSTQQATPGREHQQVLHASKVQHKKPTTKLGQVDSNGGCRLEAGLDKLYHSISKAHFVGRKRANKNPTQTLIAAARYLKVIRAGSLSKSNEYASQAIPRSIDQAQGMLKLLLPSDMLSDPRVMFSAHEARAIVAATNLYIKHHDANQLGRTVSGTALPVEPDKSAPEREPEGEEFNAFEDCQNDPGRDPEAGVDQLIAEECAQCYGFGAGPSVQDSGMQDGVSAASTVQQSDPASKAMTGPNTEGNDEFTLGQQRTEQTLAMLDEMCDAVLSGAMNPEDWNDCSLENWEM